MKPKIDLGSILLIFATSIVLVSCVDKSETYRFRLPELDEPIVGTWINESYLGLAAHNPKWIFYNWGYGETFDNVSDQIIVGTALIGFIWFLIREIKELNASSSLRGFVK